MSDTNIRGSAAIVGAFEHPLRIAPDKSEWLMQAEAIVGALDDAGLTKADIDAYFTVAPSPEGGYVRESAASMMCDYLNLQPKYVEETDIGGAAFSLFLNRAVTAIHAGLIQTAVIGYGACTRTQGAKVGTRNFADLIGRTPMPFPDAFMEPFGTTIIGYVGMLSHRYMHLHDLKPEQIAQVAVTARRYAALNPDAFVRQPITIDDVLSSPIISTPVHRLDCCIITDGAGAIVVTTPERAADMRRQPVWVLGFGEAITNARAGHNDWVVDYHEMTRSSAEQAYAMAGVGPADIDTAQVYDAFSIMVVQALAALGFVDAGDVGAFIADGSIELDGALPVNTDGGGLASNHPGRRGLFLLIEAVRQLRGECGPRQVAGAETALVNATGSAYMGIQGSAVTILGSSR